MPEEPTKELQREFDRRWTGGVKLCRNDKPLFVGIAMGLILAMIALLIT